VTVVVVLYIVGLALTAAVLLGVAVTSFATTSRVDRVLAGIGAALAGYYAYYRAAEEWRSARRW
jgi:hypothetical protein